MTVHPSPWSSSCETKLKTRWCGHKDNVRGIWDERPKAETIDVGSGWEATGIVRLWTTDWCRGVTACSSGIGVISPDDDGIVEVREPDAVNLTIMTMLRWRIKRREATWSDVKRQCKVTRTRWSEVKRRRGKLRMGWKRKTELKTGQNVAVKIPLFCAWRAAMLAHDRGARWSWGRCSAAG